MHLSHRRRVGGLFQKSVEHLLRTLAKTGSESLHNQRVRQWWHTVLGHGELLLISRRQQVLIHAQHLGDLKRTPLQMAERVVYTVGIAFVKRVACGLWVYKLATIMPEVVPTYFSAGLNELRGPSDLRHGYRTVLVNRLHGIFYLNRDCNINRAKSTAESRAPLPIRSKPSLTDFSTYASVFSKVRLSSSFQY